MKRCNYCFRYAVGDPVYCNHCGRTYNVRICSRGHPNPRTVEFCGLCGSQDFSTAAPPEGFLAWASRWILVFFVASFVGVITVAILFSIVASIDWQELARPLLSLALMLVFLYWTTTLLPGPIKKVGRGRPERRKGD